tara:strand:+ start:591 stop:740 length:150 start_codon:yes stop_codon:yes gene_type:complete
MSNIAVGALLALSDVNPTISVNKMVHLFKKIRVKKDEKKLEKKSNVKDS